MEGVIYLTIEKVRFTGKWVELWFVEKNDARLIRETIGNDTYDLSTKAGKLQQMAWDSGLLDDVMSNGFKGIRTKWVFHKPNWELEEVMKMTDADFRLLQLQENRDDNIPVAIENPDFTKLIEYAKEQVNHLAENGNELKYRDYYTWEIVMTTIFGDDYFDWHNKMV